MHNVLVVDDEHSIRESFSLILEGKHKVFLAASGEASLKIISDQKINMVYLDIRMPGLNGLETLKRMKEIDPDLEVIMVTAVNEVQKASEAIKLGARDYVVKPFDVDHIQKLTEQILRKKSILKQGLAAQKNIYKEPRELIGQSEKITGISKTIQKLKNNERILILGEPGTEKELVASIIHSQSKRSDFPFKLVSLSQEMSLPEIKSLLFGKEKGASTVEIAAQSGLLEEAKEGSIFIDNLERLPKEIFKAIAAQKFARLGSATSIPLEARLMGGASPDFANRNKEAFDFFSEVLIEIPPLRERISDLPLLVNYFLEKQSAQYKKEIKIPPSVLDVLTSYSWPGNIQELEGLIKLVFLSSRSEEINLEDLPLDILLKAPGSLGSDFLSTFEKEYVRRVFENTNQDKERAASLLGIKPQVLETLI